MSVPIRLRPFSCGWLSISARYLFPGGGREELVPASVGFFAIEHPDGLVLFDTGCAPQTAEQGAAWWGEQAAKSYPIEVSREQIADRQLAACGHDVADVRLVVLSHLHFDHAGAVGLFPNARFVVHAQELADARAPLPGFAEGYYHAPDIEPLLSGRLPVIAVEGDHDLFGDGAIRAFATPGHTRGHLSLLVELPSAGRVVLPGDACFHREALDRFLPPGDPLPAPAAWRASLMRIRELVHEQGATPLWSHVPRARYAQSPNALVCYD